jgi:type VI secretion system secreted protein Hcp
MAPVDYFLRIDGVPGESLDDKHKGEIDVMSWSWGETNPGGAHDGGAGGGAGKVTMQDFHFVTQVSKASPRLLLACASGQHLKSATLTARKAGKAQQEFLRFDFTDLLVSSYQIGASEGSDVLPIDQVSLAFSKIQMEYTEQKADGTLGDAIQVGWDQKQNKQF